MKKVLIIIAVVGLSASSFAQGSLTPPAGAPGETMKTLDEIYDEAHWAATAAEMAEPRSDVKWLAGDANYHYIISVPGSYYLGENLAVTNTSGIYINAAGVTLDLNGFEISRASGRGGSGIYIEGGMDRATVRNGSIVGFDYGIQSSSAPAYPKGCLFENLTGYADGANIGWINFEQTYGQPKVNLQTGHLSGYAWGANVGWISLSTLSLAAPDSDLDGISDAWEFGYTNTLMVLAALGKDSDGDGVPDVDEYGADTNPFDDTDHLRITGFQTLETTNRVTWPVKTTRRYTLQHTLAAHQHHSLDCDQLVVHPARRPRCDRDGSRRCRPQPLLPRPSRAAAQSIMYRPESSGPASNLWKVCLAVWCQIPLTIPNFGTRRKHHDHRSFAQEFYQGIRRYSRAGSDPRLSSRSQRTGEHGHYRMRRPRRHRCAQPD